jgi:hypothetical protein
LDGDAGIGFVCGDFGPPPANPLPREVCPVCGTSRPLRRAGQFREHAADRTDPRSPLCRASGLTPAQARAIQAAAR